MRIARTIDRTNFLCVVCQIPRIYDRTGGAAPKQPLQRTSAAMTDAETEPALLLASLPTPPLEREAAPAEEPAAADSVAFVSAVESAVSATEPAASSASSASSASPASAALEGDAVPNRPSELQEAVMQKLCVALGADCDEEKLPPARVANAGGGRWLATMEHWVEQLAVKSYYAAGALLYGRACRIAEQKRTAVTDLHLANAQ